MGEGGGGGIRVKTVIRVSEDGQGLKSSICRPKNVFLSFPSYAHCFGHPV